ncbi:hypothetical protein GVN21_06055 [Caulobacter sp. SLTY]|uniref:hypothetical protein n=1 Tax=Caulobacter sp. SLTY TaxID=2683262 RepID=UPI001412D19D|nr:hypothetical protein [Caulobacter sp. SLTY]NBB14926.1 hypothetical protein [Caulobacter sp. SLTY]
MTRSRQRTTALRVLLAIAFVWLTASYVMGAAFVVPVLMGGAEPGPNNVIFWLFSFPMVGGIVGAPFLILAGMAWFLLHRAGRATAWLATISGGGVGMALAVVLFAFFGAPIPPMITALISAPLIGWLAWRIAYGGAQPETPAVAAEAFN